LSRRQLIAVQTALVIAALLALFASSSVFRPSRSLVSLAPYAGNPQVNLDLSGFATTGGIQAVTAAQAGDLQISLAAFNALNARAGGTLEASWDAVTGIPRFLTGSEKSVRIPYTPTAAEKGNPLAIARGFLDENRALFRLNAVASDFGPSRMEPDLQLSFSNIRMPQVYKGIPVFGKQLVVHLDAQQQIVAVNGQYAPGISIPTQPTLAKGQAEQVALDDLKANQLDDNERATVQTDLRSDKTALNIYVDDKGRATLTWIVTVLTTSPLGESTIFVNARRPVLVHAIDSAENAKLRRTYTARNGTDIPGRLLAEEGERPSDQVALAAHDAAGKVYDYYSNTFHRDSIDGHGMPMVSTVHYGSDPEDAENAAWISEATQMVYGDGGRIFKPLSYGLDVVGHEFTHGVTDSTSQLIYEDQSGALNESYSDIFGAMIDRANWTIGETIVKSPPYPEPFLRSLEDPEIGGAYDPSDPLSGVAQPASMRDYADLPNSRNADNGGVHINSGIPNHAAFLVAQAIGKEKMEQIYYRALTEYLSPDANFTDAGLATVRAATDLYSATEANAVRTAFGQVGLNLGGPNPGPVASPTPLPIGSVVPGLPTPGPTAPPAPDNLPAGCRDAIRNGSFEGAGDWNEVTTRNTEIIDPQLPHTGSQSAWLGGTDQEPLMYIYQDVSIPANSTSAQLSYYRLMHEEFTGFSGLFATDANFTVLIADTDGNEIARLEELSSADADDDWHQAQFDLARYAGRTVRIVFSAENPRGNASSFFVDDVTLAVCTTGQGPSAPPTSAPNQVYLVGTIKDADTGRGVSGAQIFIIKAGLTASVAASDGDISDDEVATYATADGNGKYQTQASLATNQTYSVIIVADQYRPVIADNALRLQTGAPNPTTVNATIRSGR
jgi:Zn-dependent metalloprotease